MMIATDPISDLPNDARIYLNAILLGFREVHSFGADLSEDDYLVSCHTLIEAGLMKIRFDGANFRLVPTQ